MTWSEWNRSISSAFGRARIAAVLTLPTFLILQKHGKCLELCIRQVHERRHDRSGDVLGRILEVPDQPFVCAPARSLDGQVGSDPSALAFKLVTHEAPFLAIEGLAIGDQLCPGLDRRRGWRRRSTGLPINAGQAVDEKHQGPGVSLGDTRLPRRHAREAYAVLDDPKELGVHPVLYVG